LKRLQLIAVTAIIIVAIVSSALLYPNLSPTEPLESVTIGHVPVESFALLYVAQSEGYFKQNGLNVTVTDYPTGTDAVNALTAGTVDFAGSSEYVVAYNALSHQNISVVASLGEAQIVDLIAPNNTGITQPADLVGKTIAVPKSTVGEFDLGLFLKTNGLSLSDIKLVYCPPGQLADAVSNGTVDAVVSWQLYSEQVKMALTAGYVSWPLQTTEPFFSVLSCRNDWLSSHNQTVNKLLIAFSEAQDYTQAHPAETQQIIKARFNYTDAYINAVWSRNNCTLTLTQKLQTVMTDEAQWMIQSNLTAQTSMPAIGSYIDTGYLRAVKPEAVTIP
jgi:ABC-type nitrate/sulfonate/bicarbonate transport system substrate-binding protein